MDLDVTNPNKYKKNPANNAVAQKEVDFGREEDEELKSLLPPRRGGISTRPKNMRRKVQWNDRNGNKLTEVFEFQPSDPSDSDDDEGFDSCICTIM
ncbi:uncharacterized protein LOC131240522 [Magnolia sinica]|uniref:uncharacterized protein LOC131240522 n=1 Tax=Magnolia sinica TaxID=86752 RepID=UPI002657B811|nr:uncharacterized protein LOC131240522 [Magnolia sinica]